MLHAFRLTKSLRYRVRLLDKLKHVPVRESEKRYQEDGIRLSDGHYLFPLVLRLLTIMHIYILMLSIT